MLSGKGTLNLSEAAFDAGVGSKGLEATFQSVMAQQNGLDLFELSAAERNQRLESALRNASMAKGLNLKSLQVLGYDKRTEDLKGEHYVLVNLNQPLYLDLKPSESAPLKAYSPWGGIFCGATIVLWRLAMS